MQTHLNQLRCIHEELLAAIDGGEVERVAELVGRRGRVLEALTGAFETAGAEQRAAIQPELATLLPLDRDLQGRATALLEQLRDDIDRQRDARTHATPAPAVTGIFDRQA